MCKVIYDDKCHELQHIIFHVSYIKIRTTFEGRHIIANDNLLHGR